VHADLQHLIRIQDLDLAAERTRRQIADTPAALEALDARLQSHRDAAAAVKERIASGQAARRETEKGLAEVQGRLSKYKNQLMEVKTNKEYQAMQHEIQTAEDVVREHEDRLLERMVEADSLTAELKEAESALTIQEAEIARERGRLEAERSTAERELERVATERAAVAAQTAPAALALFEQISSHRKGVGLSEARDGLCSQCHVRLRPQMFNTLRRNESLIQCESCSRLLYFVAPAPVPSGNAADAAPQARS
jgi:predicted  nucleic acid-binding Zn-ribbon protein